ncbi:MAG: amidohydrolase family protein [Gammaproteobacteria bacterium]|nr:amidohydrolase family protein [Gammaproteobacteria bacterium]
MWGGVAVDGERITRVGADAELRQGRREIDLNERILLPGVFDPHIHFEVGERFGDEAMAEDFRHDSRDCLIGGVTSIATTTVLGRDPLPELVARGIKAGTGQAWCDFKFTGVVMTREHVREIEAAAHAGATSFKFFTGYVGEQAEGFGMSKEGIPPDMFYEACEALARCERPVFAKIHAEDPYVRGLLVDRLRRSGRADQLVAWAESTPEWAEAVQIFTYGCIAHDFRIPLYPVHISAAYTVRFLEYFMQQGVNVVPETVTSFLATTAHQMDAHGMGCKAKIQPPIRFAEDKERLWRGVREGVIKVVGTDSIPYSSGFKEGADFWECRVGLNLQMADTLPLLFDEGINQRRIDLNRLAEITSTNAAKLYGLYPKKGAIAPGSDADLVVVDPERTAVLGVNRMRSRADYSMWHDRRLKGIPVITVLRGRVVMEDGEIVANEPTGRFIH